MPARPVAPRAPGAWPLRNPERRRARRQPRPRGGTRGRGEVRDARKEIESVSKVHHGGELEWFGRLFDQGLMSWDETQRQFEVFAKEIIPYFR